MHLHLEPTPTGAKPENDVSNLRILLAEGTGPMAYLIVAMLAEFNVDLVQNEGYWNSYQADQCVGVRLPWYHRTSHFQWPIARLLRMLRGLKILKKLVIVVNPSGLEPLTPTLGMSCSIQLSYGSTEIRLIFLPKMDNSLLFGGIIIRFDHSKLWWLFLTGMFHKSFTWKYLSII